MKRAGCLVLPTRHEEAQYMLDWAAQRIPHARFVLPYASPVGIERADQVIAVLVYHDMVAGDVHISIAADSPRWASPQVVGALIGYGFESIGARRLTAVVRKGNKRSVRLIEGTGFKREGCKRKADPDGKDLVMYGMLRKEYEERYDHGRLIQFLPDRRLRAGADRHRAAA